MYNNPIVPEDFVVPTQLETDRMRLRMLTINDVEKDYEAVMSSEHRLRTVFREAGDWPNGLTLEQNTIELGWHQVEFVAPAVSVYVVAVVEDLYVVVWDAVAVVVFAIAALVRSGVVEGVAVVAVRGVG